MWKMTIRSIDEVISRSILDSCRIRPLLPMGEGGGPVWQRTNLDFFYKMVIEEDETGFVLKICNYDDSIDFSQKDKSWTAEKEKDVFIRCVFPEKAVGKKVRILYFRTQQDRDLVFHLIRKFKAE